MQQLQEYLFVHLQVFLVHRWSSKCKFYLNFFSNNWIIKELLNNIRQKKKKHDKILMLAKSKLNSIETLISQALIDLHMKEKDKYEMMKDNLRNQNGESYEIMRFSSTVNQRFRKIKKQ